MEKSLSEIGHEEDVPTLGTLRGFFSKDIQDVGYKVYSRKEISLHKNGLYVPQISPANYESPRVSRKTRRASFRCVTLLEVAVAL